MRWGMKIATASLNARKQKEVASMFEGIVPLGPRLDNQATPWAQGNSPVLPSRTAPAGEEPPRRARGALRGECLDNYHLGELLGVGGMAEVYQAEDLILHRHVAVKVLA